MVSWYETNGMAAETEPNWRMLILYPDEKRTIKLISPNKLAKDFTIQIKWTLLMAKLLIYLRNIIRKILILIFTYRVANLFKFK